MPMMVAVVMVRGRAEEEAEDIGRWEEWVEEEEEERREEERWALLLLLPLPLKARCGKHKPAAAGARGPKRKA